MTSDTPQNPEQDLSAQRETELEQSAEQSIESMDAEIVQTPIAPEKATVELDISLPEQESSEPKLFADEWLNEVPSASKSQSDPREQVEFAELFDRNSAQEQSNSNESTQIIELNSKKEALEAEIADLQQQKTKILQEQVNDLQKTLELMVKAGVTDLEERKAALQTEIEQLERRRERIREEMRTSFAGVSQDLAIRVKGFKDYLVGSLQDLAAAAEQLELVKTESWEKNAEILPSQPEASLGTAIPFTEGKFQEQTRQIKKILDRYRTRPDYYGPAWQLRRTFEPIHAERVQDWFFSQGGRGAIKTMGSRLQNILIASAIISVLNYLYGDRSRTLVLANTPERLGEWRRGLQDCLGISRGDFGPNRGVVLFESAEALVQKADRLVEEKQMPLVIIDETEDLISLSLLQFPLWLAFAPEPQQMSGYMY
jgi:hypothetical protein